LAFYLEVVYVIDWAHMHHIPDVCTFWKP